MTKRHPPLVRYLYVIGPAGSDGLQKVGLATDPRARLAALQTGVPFDLVMHLAEPVPADLAHAIERRAHRLLARRCVRNEWFETSPSEAVAAVRQAMKPNEGQTRPREWLGRRRSTPTIEPLLDAGRQFRPEAAFHQQEDRRQESGQLSLFEYAERKSAQQAAIVEFTNMDARQPHLRGCT